LKGKISRTLANKCALCVRYDALGEDADGNLGNKSKNFMEKRLKLLSSGGTVVKAGGANAQKSHTPAATGGYNAGNDFVADGGAPYKKQRT